MSTYSNDKQLIEERKQAASNKLSLNAQTAIDDLGLTPTFGGGSGEDSPVKVATFNLEVSGGLPTSAVLYFPSLGGYPATVEDSSLDGENHYLVVVPQTIYIAPERADSLHITGDASVVHDGNACYIYVTGDCTIAEGGGK